MNADAPIVPDSSSLPHPVDAMALLGVCGWSGSGKTTLLEAAIAALRGKGLRVAAVKHEAGRIDLDVRGKDSDRLFRAGADVAVQAGEESLLRLRGPRSRRLDDVLEFLAARSDLVLVEGHKSGDLEKVWLAGEGETAPPPEVRRVAAVLTPGPRRLEMFLQFVEGFLQRRRAELPLLGCVLIGGRSRRMGRPKHLLPAEGRTWLERTVAVLAARCRQVVLCGEGQVPRPLRRLVRLGDVPDARGPMAGILAALRWQPWCSWLVAACDLPELSGEAVDWLLATRRPGVWATLPRLAGAPGLEPLLAHYDYRSRTLLERLAAGGDFRTQRIAECDAVISPTPPEALAGAWTNVNTPDDLRRHAASDARP